MNNMHHSAVIDMGIFNHIDINLYPLFISVYEQKSISKAAQLLCISQSAASHALQRLRQHLQDDLFVRSGSQMQPTPFAEQIYLTIKNALISLQSVSIQKQIFDPTQIQTLKIAVHDEIEPIIFPKLVQHFQSLNLDIQFLSMKLDRKTLVADLASQQIDFAIDLEQDYGEKVQYQTLLKDQFMVCSQLEKMDVETYLSTLHLGVSSRRTGLLLEDIYFNRQNLTRQIFLRCQHYSTALQILQQQPHYILTIPQSILESLKIHEDLNIFDLPILLPQMNIGMYWHLHLNQNLRHQFLKEEIIKIFA